MKNRRIYPFLIAGAVLSVGLLIIHGLVLLGFILAGLTLAAASHLYALESPPPPLSKEEELAAWGVKWELENPGRVEAPVSSGTKSQTKPRMQSGMS